MKYDVIRGKLEPRVSEELYNAAINSLHPSPTDTCSLYLNLATVAALPVKCSRHNTPSRWGRRLYSNEFCGLLLVFEFFFRAHAITRLVLNSSVGVDESIVVSIIGLILVFYCPFLCITHYIEVLHYIFNKNFCLREMHYLKRIKLYILPRSKPLKFLSTGQSPDFH